MRTATAPAVVGQRPVEPEDQPLLRALFAESRPDLELLPEPAREMVLDMQWRAQAQHYSSAYPQSYQTILIADGVDVGRLIVDGSGPALRLVDIVVARAHRNRGIGTAVISELIAAPRPVRLSVWQGNTDAQRLYARLGFEPAGTDEAHGYLELHHPPARQEGS